ncbi:hypothetical protein LTS18_012917 [Coniosporium uncinatum]|uniref:Uncharacterized protein n=1 Tax=Coniosporium uncinatum TaxID=93489 RepID=A0ACC3D8Z2_9PEZI|nr:hypothetical protein LTS18_012917 [Coniosporium uncinatum]
MPFLHRNESPRRKNFPAISWPVDREKGLKPGQFVSHNREDSDLTGTSYSSAQSQSTGQTSLHSVETWPQSPSIDFDAHFDQFRDDLDISDEYPSQETLKAAGDISIYDADGNSMPFKNLISGETAIGERQLIVFVRHFYCGACQAYLKALTTAIPHSTYFSMPIPTSITVIGCGSPNLIPHYRQATGTPFPIFADPSRKLYKALGMSWTLDMGDRPQYMQDISIPQWLLGQVQEVKAVKGTRNKMRGGHPFQIGGEFLFEGEKVEWCHRMKHMRNHAEINVIKRMLGIEDEDSL